MTPSDPSRIASTEKMEKNLKSTTSLNTKYLDGIRGFASIFVAIRHFNHSIFPWTDEPYRVGQVVHIANLPILRLPLSSLATVSAFFVIAGMSLSFRPLAFMRKKDKSLMDQAELLTILSTSMFRRVLRLGIVPFIATTIPFLLHVLSLLPNSTSPSGEMWNYLIFLLSFSNIYTLKTRGRLDFEVNNPHLWAIPTMFRCSLTLYSALLATQAFSSRTRRMTMLGICIHSFFLRYWATASTFYGIFLAETLLEDSEERTGFVQKEDSEIRSKLSLLAFFAGLLLASTPRKRLDRAFEYPWLIHISNDRVTPEMWASIGAMMIVSAVCYSKNLQKLFTGRVARHLGATSFSLYVTHGTVIGISRDRLLGFFWSLTGRDKIVNYWIGYSLAAIVTAFLAFSVADLFHHIVERRAMNFTKWAQGQVFHFHKA